MYWSACLTLFLLSTCDGGLLRVPKVYNAIINSNENLTPSRAFPLIQPVVHETAVGYPLSPVVFQEVKQPEKVSDPEEEQEDIREQPVFEIKNPPLERAKTEAPKQETVPKNQEGPKENDPLKLNEYGLPPSLVPLQNYVPKIGYPYDVYNPYNPYFTDPYSGLILPYNYPYNPYNPYYPFPFQTPFNPYPFVPTPFYNVPPTQEPRRQWPDEKWSPPRKPESSDRTPTKKPEQPNYPPPDLNVKNNNNKNPDIPDVPPPPLPVGGTKFDNSKKS